MLNCHSVSGNVYLFSRYSESMKHSCFAYCINNIEHLAVQVSRDMTLYNILKINNKPC